MIKFEKMDATGHKTEEFNPANVVSLKDAERRFSEIMKEGYIAVKPGPGGTPGEQLRSFDASVEHVQFQPQLQGG